MTEAMLETGESVQHQLERLRFQDRLLELLRQSAAREAALVEALVVSRQWSARWKAAATRRRGDAP